MIKSEVESGELSLKDVVTKIRHAYDYLYGYKKIVIGSFILFALGGFFYAMLSKPIYNARITFVLDEESKGGGGLGAYAGIASQFGINLGGGEASVFSTDNIIELINSRFIIERTLLSKIKINNKDVLLANYYIDSNNFHEGWAKNEKLKGFYFTDKKRSDFTVTEDSLLGTMYEDIAKNHFSIDKPNKKTDLLESAYVGTDEHFAKVFVEKLIESASNFYIETKTQKNLTVVNMLQGKVDSIKNRLETTLHSAASFNDQNLNIVRASGKIQEIKQQKEIELLYTIYVELIKNLEINKASMIKETPIIQIIDRPILPLKKDKKSKLRYAILFGILGEVALCTLLLLRKFFTSSPEVS